jgi:ferredoxin-NADP reductase
MPETGAKPKVSKLQRRIQDAVGAFSAPLLPDDYLELINPLWSTRELRGRIEAIRPETPNAATIFIKPGYRFKGFKPGQYLRIGIDVNGVRHWRAYSLTSEPDRPDGLISITPKLVESGAVSPTLVRHGRVGTIVGLGGIEGDFVLPEDEPGRLLFISAGSGITPIHSMLRSLHRRERLHDVVHLHSARNPGDVIFGEELRAMHARHDGFRLHEQHTATAGRMSPEDLDRLCPDWRERETFASGPGDMLDALVEHWDCHCDPGRLHMERFQPKIGEIEPGAGGEITFCKSNRTARSDGSTPILVAGEEAGLDLPYGCREGICHTCVGTLWKGKVRDLRNGDVTGNEGESIRTCINAPEGPIEINL